MTAEDGSVKQVDKENIELGGKIVMPYEKTKSARTSSWLDSWIYTISSSVLSYTGMLK